MASSPSTSHPTTHPTMASESNLTPSEDPFRDPPLLPRHHHHYPPQCSSRDLAAAIATENTAAATSNANPPIQHPPKSPSLLSLDSSILQEAPSLHRTSRYVFAALAVAFYASTILLTAAIVLFVRNTTGRTNGRLRASGVIMGLVGGAGVLASGLTAWRMWRAGGATLRTKSLTSRMGIEKQMKIDLELRGLIMKKNRYKSLAPAVGSEPALDLDLAMVPSPLFDGRNKRRKTRKRESSDLGCAEMTISADEDHENIVHENASVEKGISIADIEAGTGQGSSQRRRTMSSRSSPSTLLSSVIAPYLSSTSDTQSQKHQLQLTPDRDQNLDLRPTSTSTPTPTPTPAPIIAITTNEQPHAHPSITRTHISSTTLSSSSSSSVSLPLQKPSDNKNSAQDLSLLHALAADMGSEDESTRHAKRKRGLDAARMWGAIDDDDDDEDNNEEEAGVGGGETGGRGGGKRMGAEAEMEGEIESGNKQQWKNVNASANANANLTGKRWGRVWARKQKGKEK